MPKKGKPELHVAGLLFKLDLMGLFGKMVFKWVDADDSIPR